MKKIGFVGAIDKSDLMICVAKVLQLLGYKTLVIDTTSTQKIKYIVPSIKPTKSYITNFEDVDFGVGFSSWEEMERYLGIRFETNEDESSQDGENSIEAKEKTEDKDELYDYILIDVDDKESLEKFDISNADKKYFLTKFDKYSLTKGMDIFSELEDPIELTKVLYSYSSCSKEDEAYLNFVSSYYQINWNDYEMYFRILGEDNQGFEENQKTQKIKFRRLSQTFKDSLAYLVQDISKADSMGKIKKAMKD